MSHNEVAEPSPKRTPHEAFLQRDRVQARRAALGVEEGAVQQFVEETEFVSLGNHCVASYGLQALDLKRRSYPFDWLRSPLSGVTHLLDTDFEDFFTYTTLQNSPSHEQEQLFSTARWGGSFWHHNLADPAQFVCFQRRVERFLGLSSEVPATRRRVFVRVLNSTRELDEVLELQAALQRTLPHCEVLLLLLVDVQKTEELIRTSWSADSILVQRLEGSAFEDQCQSRVMAACVENYARGIARALHHWAGVATQAPRTLPDLRAVSAACEQYDGGCTATAMYWPRRFWGRRMLLEGRRSRMPRLLWSDVPAEGSGDVLVADWVVPDTVSAGDVVHVRAFGRTFELTVPSGARAGSCLRLREAHGAITASLLAAAAAPPELPAASAAPDPTQPAAPAAAAASSGDPAAATASLLFSTTATATAAALHSAAATAVVAAAASASRPTKSPLRAPPLARSASLVLPRGLSHGVA